jgi:hypothetical protein
MQDYIYGSAFVATFDKLKISWISILLLNKQEFSNVIANKINPGIPLLNHQ